MLMNTFLSIHTYTFSEPMNRACKRVAISAIKEQPLLSRIYDRGVNEQYYGTEPAYIDYAATPKILRRLIR